MEYDISESSRVKCVFFQATTLLFCEKVFSCAQSKIRFYSYRTRQLKFSYILLSKLSRSSIPLFLTILKQIFQLTIVSLKSVIGTFSITCYPAAYKN
jgi:hypothetical protein